MKNDKRNYPPFRSKKYLKIIFFQELKEKESFLKTVRKNRYFRNRTFENIKFSRTRNWKDIYFMQWYLCIGYGIPFVITGIMVGIFHDQFKNAIECTVFEGDYLWILRGPVTFFILVNTIFFILILIKMRQQGVQRNSLQADSSQDCKTKQ
ncbi:adhesion G protein-coupled receptor L2-like [Clytia hemisphaerica]|uniref:adhesion G protein-coupled receptor L2-like n=1 Tax=Clytia hemisphaerica TaxID=252671 RepID=UPI0034D5B6A7